jgi:serine phosphatase RsbU (regulator of sigma subunit)
VSDDQKKRICVIDDESSIRVVLSRVLGEEYDVEGFESAEDALLADIISFDLILADVRLPGISGLDLIKELKTKDDSLPVILMTGMSDFNTAVSAIREGASDFIVKPFIIEQLLVSVHRAIERRMLVQENRRLFNEIAAKNTQLEDLNCQMIARNIQMESDIDIASNLIESLFPRSFPEIPGARFHLQMKPYEKISGDFFEAVSTGNNRFMFTLADVCGHGVPAALYSALIKSTMMIQKDGSLSTADFISHVNEYLINSHKMMIYTYVAIFCAIIDLENETITYCNAGIPAPLQLTHDGKTHHLDSTGTIVGIFTGAEYEERSVHFDKKDRIIFFTDGAFEGLPVPSTQKGYDNMVRYIESIREDKTSLIVEGLFNRLVDDTGSSIIRDDVTIIGLEFE